MLDRLRTWAIWWGRDGEGSIIDMCESMVENNLQRLSENEGSGERGPSNHKDEQLRLTHRGNREKV